MDDPVVGDAGMDEDDPNPAATVAAAVTQVVAKRSGAPAARGLHSSETPG